MTNRMRGTDSRTPCYPASSRTTPLCSPVATSRRAILRIGRRAFVNTQRITVVVRWTNTGRYAVATGDLILRLRHGGEVAAPVRSPSEVVAPESTYVGDVVFGVPPTVRTATLSAELREARTERKLTLH